MPYAPFINRLAKIFIQTSRCFHCVETLGQFAIVLLPGDAAANGKLSQHTSAQIDDDGRKKEGGGGGVCIGNKKELIGSIESNMTNLYV